MVPVNSFGTILQIKTFARTKKDQYIKTSTSLFFLSVQFYSDFLHLLTYDLILII